MPAESRSPRPQSARILLVDDPRFELHESAEEHPERPQRLHAARAALNAAVRAGITADRVIPRTASDAELIRVHDAQFLDELGSLRGRTAYLGKIDVTPADSDQAHSAAREAERTGAAYLGTIEVTANDSLDARYATKLADAPGTAYLGSIRVTPSKADKTLFASAETGSKHLSRFAVLRIVSALAFGRAGG